MKRILSWILLGFMGLNLLSAQGFSAFVDRNKVQVGGNFQVSFRLDNVQRQPIDYPDFKDFQVLSGPNVNQAFSMTNGRTSQSITFSFILRAVKEGKFSIGAASTEINGKKIKTTPIKVEVVKGAAPAPNGSNPNAAQNQSNQNAVSKDIEAQIKEAI
ncbi:MAG: BatD family protein, partial [Bacteroidota bacterium]